MRTLSLALVFACAAMSAAHGAPDEPLASVAEQSFDARVFAGLAAQPPTPSN